MENWALVEVKETPMTKVTVTIDTKSNARLFLEMVNALSFVKDVKAELTKKHAH